MSALDSVLNICRDNLFQPTEEEEIIARAELAQLRVAASEAQAAHVYLDESPVNDPNDPPLELAERAARLVDEILQLHANLQAAQERIDQQARQLEAAREIIEACASLDRYISDAGIDDARAWLAANPAPEAEPQP